MNKIWVGIVGVLGLCGCYYDTGELLRNQEDCSADSISYAQDIAPLLDRYCTSCHNSSNASGSVALDQYEVLATYIEEGSLLGSIEHVETFSPMPPDQDKLPACEILKVARWIEEGAQDN